MFWGICELFLFENIFWEQNFEKVIGKISEISEISEKYRFLKKMFQCLQMVWGFGNLIFWGGG